MYVLRHRNTGVAQLAPLCSSRPAASISCGAQLDPGHFDAGGLWHRSPAGGVASCSGFAPFMAGGHMFEPVNKNRVDWSYSGSGVSSLGCWGSSLPEAAPG